MSRVEREMSLSSDVRLRIVYGHNNPQSFNKPLGVKYSNSSHRKTSTRCKLPVDRRKAGEGAPTPPLWKGMKGAHCVQAIRTTLQIQPPQFLCPCGRQRRPHRPRPHFSRWHPRPCTRPWLGPPSRTCRNLYAHQGLPRYCCRALSWVCSTQPPKSL